jgi:hypothetical protein
MEKQNREQRRAAKFHRHQAPAKSTTWPESSPNPVFGGADESDDATAGAPDQDQAKETGPGTRGATKPAGRAPRREGAKPGNSTKG